MSAVVQQSVSMTLVKGTIQYDFDPDGNMVTVIRHEGKHGHSRYVLPTGEARQLWRCLVSLGFERW
jgi:hypothetical protein